MARGTHVNFSSKLRLSLLLCFICVCFFGVEGRQSPPPPRTGESEAPSLQLATKGVAWCINVQRDNASNNTVIHTGGGGGAGVVVVVVVVMAVKMEVVSVKSPFKLHDPR